MRLNVMDLPMAAGADSTKLLMEENHGEGSDSSVSASARQGLAFDCEMLDASRAALRAPLP